ncbi:MAG: DUF4062 domain-containing protein [Nitrospirae bacterium]|nr:DUF4062 domain-containing protein [Nitrospirota bacterium]
MKKNIFICSTAYDILDLRAEVINYKYKLGYEPIVFEDVDFFTGVERNGRHDSCLKQVEKADALILIIDKRLGAPYNGKIYKKPPKGYEDVGMSVSWAETRRALEFNKPVGIFVRDKTWEARHTYNQISGKPAPICEKCGNELAETGWAEAKVYRFLDYLQKNQKCDRKTFTTSVDLKEKIGLWLDSIFGRASHSIVTKFNSAFILASEIEQLLSKLYATHSGEIWLFNNDLELIKNEYLFQAIYVDILKKKIQDKTISSIKIILRSEKFLEFFNPLCGQRNILLKHLSKMDKNIKKIHIARLESFSESIDINLGLENLIFYTIDQKLSHPDTVCIIREESKPYTKNSSGNLKKDDLIIVCRRQDVPTFFDRANVSIQPFFDLSKSEYKHHFGSLKIKGSKKDNSLHFELETVN